MPENILVLDVLARLRWRTVEQDYLRRKPQPKKNPQSRSPRVACVRRRDARAQPPHRRTTRRRPSLMAMHRDLRGVHPVATAAR